jgi:SAM-dependent methyltransferase
MPDDEYVFADRELLHESERLHFLEAGLDPVTVACLKAIGVAPGWRCLEVGAGAGSMARWLAQRAGPGGEVVAVDYNPRYLSGLPSNVTVRKADVREQDAFQERDFDLVHCRLLLMYLSDRADVLRRMAQTLRPGGILLAEEPDFGLSTSFGDPDARERAAVDRRIMEARRKAGPPAFSFSFGNFWEQFLDAGIDPIDVRYTTAVSGPGDPLFQMFRLNLPAPGSADEKTQWRDLGADDHDLALIRGFYDHPDSRLVTPTVISAWGRRP